MNQQKKIVLEKFFCGYSPGDKEHTVTKILKVTSEIGKKVDELYYYSWNSSSTYNKSYRDINIAFVNELAIIFNKLGINTNDVLAAAGI